MSERMLIALKSGWLIEDGEIVEIARGKDRIAPEVLARCPDYAEFFDPDVSVRGTDAERSVFREMEMGVRFGAED